MKSLDKIGPKVVLVSIVLNFIVVNMSKKIFLKRTYAEVAGDYQYVERSEEEGEPGECIIPAKMRCFTYKQSVPNEKSKKIETPRMNKKPPAKKPKPQKFIFSSALSDTNSPSGSLPKMTEVVDSGDVIIISSDENTEQSDDSDSCSLPPFTCEPQLDIKQEIEISSSNSESSHNEPTIHPSTTEYYHDLVDLPVLFTKQTGSGTFEALRAIINPSLYPVATMVPYDISANVSFLVSVRAIGSWRNILSDGMGSWGSTGKKTKFVSKTMENIMSFISGHEYGSKDTFKTFRRQFINKSEASLHKIIISAEDCHGKELDHIFVQYYFTGEEKDVVIKPHGNAKSVTRPYIRSKQSTKDIIKDLSKSKKPSEVFHEILEKQGGICGLRGPGDIPRNRQQISDIKKQIKSTNEKDELKVLMDKISSEKSKPDNSFIFELNTDPELILFIANDRQLNDIEIFCTNPANFCILGVDPTFNIGDFMVTLVSYRNLKLKTQRMVNPVMMGPVLIHQRKLEHSYFELPCKMIKHRSNLSQILAFGTDGEHNLQKAFEFFLPNAIHLLCDIHMKDNIKSKLSKLQIVRTEAYLFMQDIFGKDLDQERQPGLVDAMSNNDFEKKLQTLRPVWEARHINGAEFYIYFSEEKSQLIKNHMTAKIRSMSGLGYPPIQYTQNANESLNRAFKSGLDKKLSITECVTRLQHFISKQQEQVNLSIISCGEYEVTPDYKHITVPEVRFYRMGQKSRKACLKRFNDSEVVPKHNSTVLTLEKEKGQSHEQMLSVPISKCGVTKVPYEIMTKIYANANKILNVNGYMVKAPGSIENQFFVVSLSDPGKPHTVKVITQNGNIACDINCIRWKSYKICPHVLVVADSIPGCLKKFLEWHKQLKEPGTNMMAIATHNLPKGRGKKISKATSVRKGAASSSRKSHPVSYIGESNTENRLPCLPDPIPGSYMLAILDFCSPNVSKCFGCHGRFKYQNENPAPPRNMVVVSKMTRRFFLPDGTEKEGQLSNVYFHFNENCIKKKDSYFQPALLYCPEDLKPHLLDIHKAFLQSLDIQI